MDSRKVSRAYSETVTSFVSTSATADPVEVDSGKREFASRLAQAMDARQLKQVDLLRVARDRGHKLGKSQLSQYLSGKTIPRKGMLHFLAESLGVNADWLLNGIEPMGAQSDSESEASPGSIPPPTG